VRQRGKLSDCVAHVAAPDVSLWPHVA